MGNDISRGERRGMQLTVRDVSRFLNTPESRVIRWVKQRGLPSQYVGGQYRFNRVDLLEWATTNRMKVSVELFDRLEAEDELDPNLVEALEAGGIFYKVKDTNKELALRAMVEVLPLPEGVDRELLLRLFLAREASASTAIGDGVALPHVRNPIVLHVERPMVTLCFLERPVDFAALDGKPVRVLFSLICPTMRSHLQILSRLSYALHDEGFKGVVMRQPDRDEILREARGSRRRSPRQPSAGKGEPDSWTSRTNTIRRIIPDRRRSPRALLATLVGAGGAVVMCLFASVPTLRVLGGGPPESARWAWDAPHGAFCIGLDALSAFFLLPVVVLSALAAVYGGSYLFAYRGRKSLGSSWFFFNLFVVGMIMVVIARTSLLFLLSWEVMSISAFFLVTFEHENTEVRRAGWVYLVATHLGVAFLFATFVLLGRNAGSLEFAAFDRMPALDSFWSGLIFVLALIGFGTKAGFVPFHVWLPEAHPAAPFPRLGLDVGRDDQDGALRALAGPDVPRGAGALVGADARVSRLADGFGRDLSGCAAARYEACVGLLQHREHGADRPGDGCESVGLGQCNACRGCAGDGCRAAPSLESRAHEKPDVLRRRQCAARYWHEGHGKARRTDETDAVDRQRDDGRGGCALRLAAVERLRQRMDDVPESDEVRVRDQRWSRSDGPPGGRTGGAGRGTGRHHLRTPHRRGAAGFATQRSRSAQPRVLALDGRADGVAGLPVPDRSGRSACGRGLAAGGHGPGPRHGGRSNVPGDGVFRSPARNAGLRQRLDADRPGDGGGCFRGVVCAGTAAEGPTWGCGYLMPTVRMQYTGRSFAEMIAEHLLPRFLRPRTTCQAPRGVFPSESELRGQTAPTRSAKSCTSRFSALGGTLFPASHSPAGESPRLPGIHGAHGRTGPGLGIHSQMVRSFMSESLVLLGIIIAAMSGLPGFFWGGRRWAGSG